MAFPRQASLVKLACAEAAENATVCRTVIAVDQQPALMLGA